MKISSQSTNENPHTNNINLGIKNTVNNVNNISNPVSIKNNNHVVVQGKLGSTTSCSGSPGNQVCNSSAPGIAREVVQVPVRVPIRIPVRVPVRIPVPVPIRIPQPIPVQQPCTQIPCVQSGKVFLYFKCIEKVS